MKLPLYQTHWHNIDLTKLAKSLGHSITNVVDSRIYLELYSAIMKRKKLNIERSFIEKKEALSKWVLHYLKKNSSKKSKGLSVGCGLGIVEKSLILSGLNIDLQECQNISVQYLNKTSPGLLDKTTFILSEDLKEVPSESYGFAMAITSTYPLDDNTLDSFLSAMHRVLKKDGIFIWYETAFTWNHLILAFWWTVRRTKHAGVLWGWRRSMGTCKVLAKRQKLFCKDIFYFNAFNEEIKPKMFLGLSTSSKAAWQMGVFQK